MRIRRELEHRDCPRQSKISAPKSRPAVNFATSRRVAMSGTSLTPLTSTSLSSIPTQDIAVLTRLSAGDSTNSSTTGLNRGLNRRLRRLTWRYSASRESFSVEPVPQVSHARDELGGCRQHRLALADEVRCADRAIELEGTPHSVVGSRVEAIERGIGPSAGLFEDLGAADEVARRDRARGSDPRRLERLGGEDLQQFTLAPDVQRDPREVMELDGDEA